MDDTDVDYYDEDAEKYTEEIEGVESEDLEESGGEELYKAEGAFGNVIEISDVAAEKQVVQEEEDDEDYDPLLYPYGKRYRPITQAVLKEISQQLSLIKLSWPDDAIPDPEKRKFFPDSYRTNSKKEKLMLWYAENFRRQYHYTHPDRRPLLLAAENDCGIQKMVCTTLRPTTLPYPEMYDWEGCSKFVADHLHYVPLKDVTIMPVRIRSPRTVINTRRGNCFEYSLVLCSYLIGVGYDAYVVSGYATREFCINDHTKVECPFPSEFQKEEIIEEPLKPNKYRVKSPRDLRSKFVKRMEIKAIWDAGAEQRKLDEEERLRILAIETPPPDALYGYRIHSWVVILPGSREISEPFFIESVTGVRYELDSQYHLGLESIWNNENYWVSLQECTERCKNLQFDLTDLKQWEHLFIAEPFTTRVVDTEEEETEDFPHGQEKHIDVPPSWVESLFVPWKMFECRFPIDGREDLYKKTKVERFGPYIQWDGLVMRVTKYNDYEYTDPIKVYEVFTNRADCLTSREHDLKAETICERFAIGREDCVKEHWRRVSSLTVASDHRVEFYNRARADGLVSLEMHLFEELEIYKNRPDFLEARHSYYDKRARFEGMDRRFIMRVNEKFGRNPAKPAREDIAERDFLVTEDKVKVKYHYEDNRNTAATREYIKPLASDQGEEAVFNPELTTFYQVDPNENPPKQIKVYRLFELLLDEEKKTMKSVREMEDDLGVLLKLRAVEVSQPILNVSAFDNLRNDEAKEMMEENEKKLREQTERDVEEEVDYLAPYMQRLGNPPELSAKLATRIRNMCLSECKQRLVDRANKMQSLFEITTLDLQARHKWYEEEQDNLTREDEEEYFNYCNRTTFFLHTLEIRLNRHRDLAPQRYLAMETYLRNDKRLSRIKW